MVDTGKEKEKDNEAPLVARAAGRRVSPMVPVVVVAVLVVGAVAGVLLMRGDPRTGLTQSDVDKRPNPTDWLDIPVLKIEDIPLSVPLVASGSQRKQLQVAVTIRFAPPEGAEVDIDRLKKEFLPRAASLSAEFRHIIIEEMNSKDYSKLVHADARDTLLKTFNQKFNDMLKAYGMHKDARVDSVMWNNFFWE
jgi:flagellar basal body-associated protein FliL